MRFCVCLTSCLFFHIQPRRHIKASERENQTDWPAEFPKRRRPARSTEIAQDGCFVLKNRGTFNMKRGYSNKVQKIFFKVMVAEGSPAQWAWLTAQLTTSKGFCWPGTAKRDVEWSLNRHVHLHTCIPKWYSACLWARHFNACFNCCQNVCVKGAACHYGKILSLALLKRVRQENHTQICTVNVKLQPGDG